MRFFLILLISFSLNAEEGFDDSGFDDNFSDELIIPAPVCGCPMGLKYR
jgi:hypothetical protein